MTKIIDFNAHLNNKYFLKGDNKKEIYLYVDLQAQKIETSKERIPLNISLVLDRSGSMSGKPLEYVKKATKFVIDNLHSSDVVSIVQYDSVVDVVSESKQVTNKQDLHKRIDSIQSRGMTNLSGGMLEGYKQVKSTKKDNYVNRVLLLSDGHANQGITDVKKLQEIAQTKFRELGIGLSTFGVGADFNEDLMTNLSEYGGANYYFIESPEKVPEIFAQELEGLLAVIAQNARFSVKFDSDVLACEKVYGYPSDIKSDSVSVNFNDIFSEEQKSILIKFTLKKELTEAIELHSTLSYDDVVKTMDTVEEKRTHRLELTEDAALYKESINKATLENIASFAGNELLEKAIKAMDGRNFETAKSIIAKAKIYVETHLEHFPNSETLTVLLKEIVDYAARIESMKNMSGRDYMVSQKMSKMASYKQRKRK